jgi:hypothetical protein
MHTVHKIDIAVEQLADALEAYFKGRFHSATVLAGASEQLFSGHLLKHGLTSTWRQDRKLIVKIANGLKAGSAEKHATEKEIGDLMNHAYNNSKHASSTDHTLQMDARTQAARLIDRAISDFDQLCGRVEYHLPDLPLAQRFREESISAVRTE